MKKAANSDTNRSSHQRSGLTRRIPAASRRGKVRRLSGSLSRRTPWSSICPSRNVSDGVVIGENLDDGTGSSQPHVGGRLDRSWPRPPVLRSCSTSLRHQPLCRVP